MNKSLLIISVLILLYFSGFSQEYDPYTYQDIKEKKVLSDKVFFGGGMGLQFGTYTVIKLTPEIGYRPFENLDLGIGIYYMYVKYLPLNYKDHVYGGNVFSRFYIIPNLFLQGEYEMLNVEEIDFTNGYYTGRRIFVPGILGGIGYRQRIGERSAVLTTLLYNFSMTENTPYNNPIFRISFIF